MLNSKNLPYNVDVMAAPLPLKFKVPQIEMYDGFKDNIEHLESFKAHITLHGFSGEVACRAFPLTLKEASRAWFGFLPSGSNDKIGKLARLFSTKFMHSRRRRRLVSYPVTVKQ